MERRRIAAALVRARAPGPPRLEVLGGPSHPSPSALGLVPGSFDPMTIAHAALAEALPADLVLLVYSPAGLGKETGPGGEPSAPLLRPEERVVSLLAYARSRPGVGVALASHGLLADQAEASTRTFPGASVVIGVGSDKLAQIFDPKWYEDRDAALARLFRHAGIAYAVRSGDEEAVEELLRANPRWRDRIRPLDVPREVAAVSSRTVREMIRGGQDVSALVPAIPDRP